MITILCDFCQFSAKKGVFLKKQCYDQLFAKTSSSLMQKTPIFRRKYFKNHNIGPRPVFLLGELIPK
jgi:hypothetical protein